MKLQDHLRVVMDYLKEVRSMKNSEILATLDENVDIFNEILPQLQSNSSVFKDDRGFYLGIEWPLPFEWPLALDSSFISSDTEADKIMRAEGIISTLPSDWHRAKFLDFGCGEGHVVAKAEGKASFAMGYDIKEAKVGNCTTDWKKVVANGPYDFILLFDVLDHLAINPIKILPKIKSILAPGGMVWVRCHPWSSRHGGHLYSEVNKAYAHLVFSESELNKHGIRPEKTIKLKTPLDEYWNWFVGSGFTVEKESITTENPENYFSQGYIQRRLFAMWENHEFVRDLRINYPFSVGTNMEEGVCCFRRPHPDKVGSYQPNRWGFFDMHGNVWEWCEDSHVPYTVFDYVSFDPCVNDATTNNKIIRGGGCWDIGDNLRSACRLHSMMPEARNPDLGFRVVLETGRKEPKYVNDIGMTMLRVEAGVFWMGSPPNELGRNLELEQQHLVRITKPYYMSAHPVTQQHYEAVVGVNPSEYKDPKIPVTNVNWIDAKKFCEKLSDKTDETYRLPTEAEWEHACRGLNFNNSVGAILSVQFADYILR